MLSENDKAWIFGKGRTILQWYLFLLFLDPGRFVGVRTTPSLAAKVEVQGIIGTPYCLSGRLDEIAWIQLLLKVECPI